MDWVHNMPAVFGIVTRINGKRRTPKIEALHRMIERVLRDLEIDKQRRPILSNGFRACSRWPLRCSIRHQRRKSCCIHMHIRFCPTRSAKGVSDPALLLQHVMTTIA
jgi:hypothetical protein